jgi:hypothetical protein
VGVFFGGKFYFCSPLYLNTEIEEKFVWRVQQRRRNSFVPEEEV